MPDTSKLQPYKLHSKLKLKLPIVYPLSHVVRNGKNNTNIISVKRQEWKNADYMYKDKIQLHNDMVQ